MRQDLINNQIRVFNNFFFNGIIANIGCKGFTFIDDIANTSFNFDSDKVSVRRKVGFTPIQNFARAQNFRVNCWAEGKIINFRENNTDSTIN